MHASNKPVSEDEEEDDVFSRRPLYYGRAGSGVIGCRRPTGGVFIYMLHTRVTLTAFPIATPRGRSSKFPWRGTNFSVKTAMLKDEISLRECEQLIKC